MIDGASLDDYRRDRGLGPDSPIDGADHAAWLAVRVGGTDVLVHDGECFELAEDLRVRFTTQWRAPFAGGGEGVLPDANDLHASLCEQLFEVPVRQDVAEVPAHSEQDHLGGNRKPANAALVSWTVRTGQWRAIRPSSPGRDPR